MTALRKELPPLPERMKGLPVDKRGYPVPWFVGYVDSQGREAVRGFGTPDFRVVRGNGVHIAYREKKCWVCGGRLGHTKAFVLGPMCAITRTAPEPPSHIDCAIWSATACPFLARPHARRREAGMPPETVEPAGHAIKRNPGVALVWVTKSFQADRVGSGMLFVVGDPVDTLWFAEGRKATHAEVMESIDSGYPLLYDMEGEEGVEELQNLRDVALTYLPTAGLVPCDKCGELCPPSTSSFRKPICEECFAGLTVIH